MYPLLLEKMEQLLGDNVHFSQKVALLSMQLGQLQAGQLHRKCPVVLLDKFDGSLAQHFWTVPAVHEPSGWATLLLNSPSELTPDRVAAGPRAAHRLH